MSEALLEIHQVAKALNLGVGRNEMYVILRDKKVLKKDKGHNNMPYQKLVNEGYFVLQEKTYARSTSSVNSIYRPYVTEKGFHYIKGIVEDHKLKFA